MNKAELRARMRAQRRALADEAQRTAQMGAFEQIAAFEPYRRARVVMAYIACRGEVSLAPVIEDVLSGGRVLVLPRCEAPGVMTARRICTMDDLTPGTYGLLEPKTSCEIVQPQEIDLILAPGVAFDGHGNRLGQGGGYYDRFIPETNAVTAGVCHSGALLDSVPAQAHDCIMDYVITPEEIIETNQTGGCGHG